MKLKKFLKDEKGAVLPFVAIILGLFALGFTALVIDAGTLYVQRKAMITSADAAALAGAQVLKEGQGAIKSGAKTKEQIELEAETTAKSYATVNGADLSQIEVFVGNKSVTIPSGVTENRQVVEVTVGKNQSLIFARFLGDEDTDVKAYALATWGYVTRSSYCPLFVFDTAYKENTNMALHDNVTLDNESDLKTNSYGFIQVGAGEGMNDIKKAIEGTIVVEPKSVDDVLNGAPGKRESVYDSAVKRIGDTVIVPIISWEEFKTDTDNLDKDGNIIKNPADWELPIAFFACFTITNVIKQSENGVDSVQIEGYFTGKKYDKIPVVEVSDQTDLNPGGDPALPYSKLIK